MKRRDCLALMGATSILSGCAGLPTATGTGDLGVVVARATGTLAIVNTSERKVLAEVQGLGDLSHASVVFSRDGRYAYVFGRDGGLTKVDLLTRRIAGRVMQAGNSIGGAISADGSMVVAQNYTPGGIKVFDAATLAQRQPGEPAGRRAADVATTHQQAVAGHFCIDGVLAQGTEEQRRHSQHWTPRSDMQ